LREIASILSKTGLTEVVSGFPNYLIFYRSMAGGVEIVRVLHVRRRRGCQDTEPATAVAWFGQKKGLDGKWVPAGCFKQGFYRSKSPKGASRASAREYEGGAEQHECQRGAASDPKGCLAILQFFVF